MNTTSRLEKLKDMASRFPEEPQARLFLAHELFKAEDWEGAAEHFAAHIRLTPGDTGAAWKSLGLCHERLGRPEAAADAYRRGVEAAEAHSHEGLASEIKFLLNELSA